MSRKKKNQQGKQNDLTIAKLAVLAAVLQIVNACIQLVATILRKSSISTEEKGTSPSPCLYCIRLGGKTQWKR